MVLDPQPRSAEPWSVAEPAAGVSPVGDGARIRSLAVMARALGHSARLEAMIEIAVEEAVAALDAAGVSVSRLEPGTGRIRTIINAGYLGPGEDRRPVAETYRLEPPFTDGDLAYTEALAAILACAVSRALREETLERLACR